MAEVGLSVHGVGVLAAHLGRVEEVRFHQVRSRCQAEAKARAGLEEPDRTLWEDRYTLAPVVGTASALGRRQREVDVHAAYATNRNWTAQDSGPWLYTEPIA
jgi:hypothetical protein